MNFQLFDKGTENFPNSLEDAFYFMYPAQKCAPFKPPKPMPFKADVYTTQQEYVVEAELSGFNKENITISLERDVLTIEADNTVKPDETTKYLVKERKNGKFIRTFQLPKNVNRETSISTQLKDGILTITFAKQDESANKRTIKIE